jgi:site-specific recombinase XerD
MELFLTRFKSDISRRKHGDNLVKLEAFLGTRGKDFATAAYEDVLAWLQGIDKENVLEITKERYRRIAYQYFRFLKVRQKLRDDIPVPEREEFQFKEKDRTADPIAMPLDLGSADRILAHFKFTSIILYTGTRILKEAGMRIGELVNIKKSGLDIAERRIYTAGKRGLSRYFIPASFQDELGRFVSYQDQVNPDQAYLFPPLYKRGGEHVHDQFFRANLEKAAALLGITCSVNPHAWRDLINSCRADKFKLQKDRDALLSALLCQEPQGVNAAHYLKMYSWKNPATWKAHRDLYDQLYPY